MKDRLSAIVKAMTISIVIFCIGALILILFSGPLLTRIGNIPVVDDSLIHADAVVVLYTGVEYYSRLVEASRIFKTGLVKWVVINGNRKSNVLREIEEKGYTPGCHWAENYLRILELYGVPRAAVIAVDAEDAFDTISEAQKVGKVIMEKDIRHIILTTSKFHTRRARHIWRSLFAKEMTITAAAAKSDPYTPAGWWKQGRQIRWVMMEYGAWGYYLWHHLTSSGNH
ncbi:MAG: YdcF family protein [Desulfobacteraceae bacterium]|jgi:uncharacterized SAM-binding protein YcdF (DUF218 family)